MGLAAERCLGAGWEATCTGMVAGQMLGYLKDFQNVSFSNKLIYILFLYLYQKYLSKNFTL